MPEKQKQAWALLFNPSLNDIQMALPNVNIGFANGALGTVEASADGVVGMLAYFPGSSELPVKKAVCVHGSSCLEKYGITDGSPLYKAITDFYTQAGEGAELWIYGVNEKTIEGLLAEGQTFLKAANGTIRVLAIVPESGVAAEDITSVGLAAQSLSEWATKTLYAPVVVGVPVEFTGEATDYPDLGTFTHNRVLFLVGDNVSGSKTAMIGILCGRIAQCAVQTNIGRVKDGALAVVQAYIGTEDPSVSDDVESLNNRSYVTLRTFVGKSGYFFADDHLATSASDDYHSLARRRTADKAYRVAYATLVDEVNENLNVTNKGTLEAATAKNLENEIVSDIYTSMTQEGNLSVDSADTSDKGVKVVVDTTNDVLATNKIKVAMKVKPYGYSKYIDVELGFLKE